jgi:hypothetical protein
MEIINRVKNYKEIKHLNCDKVQQNNNKNLKNNHMKNN